tara:strand:+ start:887 stop:1108 length:222 start_codon:yes stop_codon:yes gene_type:complete
MNFQELEKIIFLANKNIDRLKDQNAILVEALKDILSGTPAIDRAEKTLRYLGKLNEAEEMNPNQENKKNQETN